MGRSADPTARQDRRATCSYADEQDLAPGRSPYGSFSNVALHHCLARSEHVDRCFCSLCRTRGRHRLAALRDALRTGLIFGIVEATTPILGWIAGVAASRFVQAVDHWITFALLAGVGIHMLDTALWGSTDNPSKGRSLPALMATAVGTSIDAMAVGISLAFLQVSIVIVAIAIGLATFAMSSGGMLVGRLIGNRLGRLAELIAGLALCGLGTMILFKHLSPM